MVESRRHPSFDSPAAFGTPPIVTPAGSTIEPEQEGGYRVCDRDHHCSHADNLWQAQQLVQWAELHHRPLDEFGDG
jgi:hypothetical protein